MYRCDEVSGYDASGRAHPCPCGQICRGKSVKWMGIWLISIPWRLRRTGWISVASSDVLASICVMCNCLKGSLCKAVTSALPRESIEALLYYECDNELEQCLGWGQTLLISTQAALATALHVTQISRHAFSFSSSNFSRTLQTSIW